MKIKHILSSILFVWLAASCAEETPYIDIDSSERATVSLGARESSLETFSFSTNQTWTASDDADWLTLSPTSGGAGNNTLTLKAEQENRTGETRTATITLTTATLEQEIKIEQEADRYIRLEEDTIRAVASLVPGGGEWIVQSMAAQVPDRSLKLEVASTNEKAIRLYQSLGFRTARCLAEWREIPQASW